MWKVNKTWPSTRLFVSWEKRNFTVIAFFTMTKNSQGCSYMEPYYHRHCFHNAFGKAKINK